MKRFVSLFLVVFAAGTMFAQERTAVPAVPAPVAPVLCPYPYSNTIAIGATPTPIVTEFPTALQPGVAGSVLNQTSADKHFGHTFTFPSQRECCVMNSGTLTVTIKALQSGCCAASSNDAVHAVANGAIIQSKQPWLNTNVSAGTSVTVTFQLTAAQLASGKVSFYVQDDSAVTAASLTVNGCCIRKP